MSPRNKKSEPPPKLRISQLLVMDQATLKRAQAKAAQHGVPLTEYLEEAVALYGKFLDKKISVVPRPI